MPTEAAVIRAALRNNPEHHAKLRELAESGLIGPLTDIPADDPLTIIAAPEHFGIDGAQQAKCACGLIVWLSPSTQAMILRRDGNPTPPRILCAWCWTQELRATFETAIQ